MTSKPTEVRYIYTFPLENEISSWKHVKCYYFTKIGYILQSFWT